jgi:YtkA-like
MPGLVAACALGGTLASAANAAPSDGTIGPGEAHVVLTRSGCEIEFTITPNLGGHIASTFTLELTRAGRPVRATVSAVFTMQAMPMPPLGLRLKPKAPGIYQASGEKLTMPGRWQIRLHIIAARDRVPLDVVVTDIATVE